MRVLSDEKIIGILRCPICKEGLAVKAASLVCFGARQHCFDFASGGYVNLSSPKHSGAGDSKEAVRARSEFLNKDYYKPVSDELQKLVSKHAAKNEVVLDAGCGEGYYTCGIAQNGYSVMGVDLSKFATDASAKRAARTDLKNTFFATASVFELPVADESLGAICSVFAPCAEDHFCEKLKSGGYLFVAWAGENHLLGLKRAMYDEVHTNTERADMPSGMELVDQSRVEYTVTLDNNKDIMSLFAMTPYYWRTSLSDGDKLRSLESLTTEVDIIISVYKKLQ